MTESRDGFWSLSPMERTRIVAEKLLMRMQRMQTKAIFLLTRSSITDCC